MSYGRPGIRALGSGTCGERAPALQLQRARVAVVREQAPGALAGRGVDRVAAELLFLGRVRERVHPGAVLLARLPGGLEPADRLGVLDQLVDGHLDLVEERPPDRLALAVVVVEQLRRQQRERVVPAREQLLAQRGTRLPLRRQDLGRLRLWERKRPELLERLGAPLEQPVAQQQRRQAVLAVVLVDLAQQRVVARLHPLLEDDDRGAAVLHLRPPREVEETLQLLQPVAGP